MNRFSQKDIIQGGITEPTSLNRYLYVQNDPMNFTNPSGESLRSAWNSVKSVAKSVATTVTKAANTVKTVATNVYNSAKTAVTNVVNKLTTPKVDAVSSAAPLQQAICLIPATSRL